MKREIKRGQKFKAIFATLLLLIMAFESFTITTRSSTTRIAPEVYASDLTSLGLPTSAWNLTFGGTGIDYCYSIVQTLDGGYVLAGRTASYGAGVDDFWLVRVDSSGNYRWNKTYGAYSFEYGYSVVETADGGYAIAGTTGSFSSGSTDFWLVKTNATGEMQWNKKYGGTGGELAYSLIRTNDSGYAIAGYTDSFGAGLRDAWVVKTDSSGNELWNKTYGGAQDDYPNEVIQTDDGGYAIAGYTESFGAGQEDAWLIKTDPSGNVQWNRTYGGTSGEYVSHVVQTSDGGYAITTSTQSFGAGSYDFWLVKTDSSGNAQWNKTYGGPAMDEVQSVILTADGGFVLTGYTQSYGSGMDDYWLVKTDVNGNAAWNLTFGGAAVDRAFSVVQTYDEGYALAGYTSSYGAGLGDFWMIKLDVDLPPEPWIVEPAVEEAEAPRHGDILVVQGNEVNVSAVEIYYADDIQQATFLYSADGFNWTIIGTDYNFTDPYDGCIDVYNVSYRGFHEWSASWNTTGFSQGLYHIKVLMTDSVGQYGEDQIQVYFEPTAPVPYIYTPTWGSTVKGVVDFNVTTDATDVQNVFWDVMNGTEEITYDLNKVKNGVPKVGEYYWSPDLGYLYAAVSCAWNAKAALIMYWANESAEFKKLIQDDKGNTLDKDALLKKMLEIYNSKTKGAKKKLSDGLNYYEDKFLFEEWLKYTGLTEKLALKVKCKPTEGESIPVKDLKEELKKGPVEVHIAARNKNGKMVLHAMILTSLKDTPLSELGQPEDWIYEVDFMDPYKEQGGSKLGKCYRITKMKAVGHVKMDWNEDGKEDDPDDGWYLIFSKVQILPKAGAGGKSLSTSHTVGPDVESSGDVSADHFTNSSWNLAYDTTATPDGYYFFTATMVDTIGNNCSDVVEVFVNNHPADINKDGTVDIYDAIVLAGAFNSNPNSPNWYFRADLNGDEAVDIYDAIILAGNYGRTY